MSTPRESHEPPVSLSLMGHGLDLEATLTSGQAFSWKRTADGRWRGWIDGLPCLVWSQGDALRAVGPGLTRDAVSGYFGLDIPAGEILSSFPEDPWLEKARAFAPGLRILRQEPWETLCNFICSSLKQIVQIEQINHELRRAFGDEIGEGLHSFPDATRLALATEAKLRACKLGFRARHLFVAARQVASSEVSLERIAALPTEEAREHLVRIRGVGEKVANCILLFAYGRAEVFPIDVWVERVLRRLYFNGSLRVKHERLRAFADSHFGPYRGYAQQFLFHWIRNDPKALPPEKGAAVRVGGKAMEGRPPA
ncbi:MAG TPA: DNA glycosylase [Candidatus Methylacidiphilales bacterium]|jgi:N-glycosylase/DNA lyase|nr:DNA glycosylase [Candidatus Methylacidiphilales bacterium]